MYHSRHVRYGGTSTSKCFMTRRAGNPGMGMGMAVLCKIRKVAKHATSLAGRNCEGSRCR